MDYKTINWKNGFIIGIICCFFYFLYIIAEKVMHTTGKIRHTEERLVSALSIIQQIMSVKDNTFFKR